MRRIVALALALCMLFASCAFAEEADLYVPGARTRELFGAAFDAGKLITGDLTLHLDLDPEVFAFGPEEIDQVNAVLKVIDKAHISFGMGKFDGGFRLELGAALEAQEGGNPASIDAAANLTWDNISLESNLLPGKRVTLEWETLMALMRLDSNAISAVSQLRQLGPDVVMREISKLLDTTLGDLLERFSAAATPYLTIFGEHAVKLDMQVQENVPAQGNYPAAAWQITTYISVQEIASFVSDIADRLVIDGFVAANSSDLVDLRKSIAELKTKQGGFIVTVGLDGDGLPLFLVANVDGAADKGVYMLSFIRKTEGEADGLCAFDIYALHSDAAGSGLDTFSMSCAFTAGMFDPQLKNGGDMNMTISVVSDGAPLYGYDYSMTIGRATTDDGLPSVVMSNTFAQTLENVRMIGNGDTSYALTADGGESVGVTSSFDTYVNKAGPAKTTVQASSAFAPDGDGGVAGQSAVAASLPDYGLNAYGIGLSFTSKDYDPQTTAALDELALEALTVDEMNSLQQVLAINVMSRFFAIVANLPEPLASMAKSEMGML